MYKYLMELIFLKTCFKIQVAFIIVAILLNTCLLNTSAGTIDFVKVQTNYDIINSPNFSTHSIEHKKPYFFNPLIYNYSASKLYQSSIYYENLIQLENANDVRQNMVNLAKSQLGYIEGNNSSQLSGASGKGNYTEYGRWYGMQDEWCAMFVSWCANLAGETNVPKHALCRAGLKKFIDAGTAHSRQEIIDGKYIPQPGDIIYFCTSSAAANGKLTTHVGIVTDYKDGRIYTIEGNTTPNDKSISCGGIVEEKTYKITNTYVAYVCELI